MVTNNIIYVIVNEPTYNNFTVLDCLHMYIFILMYTIMLFEIVNTGF